MDDYNTEKHISELEKKELEKLGFYSDEDEEDNDSINISKKTNKPISIFKSKDFNDFPKSNPIIAITNTKKPLLEPELNIKIKSNKKQEDNKIDEVKNNIINEDEEDIIYNDNINNIKENDDSDNEINLAEQLKQEYEENYFSENEKIKEDLSDQELISMSKENIIQYKNYQILKLKTIIKNLKQEKEILTQSYKKTTDNLLNHIKELEYKGTGERPVTAKIIHKIVSKNDFEDEKFEKKRGEGGAPTHGGGDRCPNCGKIIKINFMEHSLECIRKKYKCIYCNELMNIEDKDKHNKLLSNKINLYKNIINKNCDFVIKALKHNFPINNTILDEKTGDYFIHLIIKNNIFNVIKKYDNTIDINIENKQKETPLFLAVNKNDINIVKELVFKGADIKRRNKSDMSPLMFCCKNNFQNIAEFLIKNGADVNEKNILGDTPVKLAQLNGNEELALKLIKIYKADIN